ncbi:MAG: hypothetical protein A2X34_01890 [Elusimicrobia bacterium GWC2_51_8]|nr:MAG: hypothetical protein A2X33_02900 [Elusimicrobia bacterium GWA2_51_34]OGR61192.1 MAG: hypothetical protein A2X34_01890 [Elusimicrobia bacterium GWC2_51_8]OGR86587.1 MAG: hypothetical protein A2021_06320 [Elusimicrobia bacterium GWF2_52_66]HAF95576.1 hypothetical protein [Elusimicrobiota bacterium]HCE97679.1 hypothetical protein [Elusimicrobiota bacterium]
MISPSINIKKNSVPKVLTVLVLTIALGGIWQVFFANPLGKRLVAVTSIVREAALKELNSSSPPVKKRIAEALINTLKHPPLRIFTFDFDDDYGRSLHYWVEDAFAKVGKPGVPILIKALREEDNYIRSSVVIGLAQIGPEARVAIPDLFCIYKNPGKGEYTYEALQGALTALTKIAPGDPAVDAFLLEALKDNDFGTWRTVSGYAVESSTMIIGGMFQVMLKSIISGSINRERSSACFGVNSKAALPHLITALRHKNIQVRMWACNALGNMESAAIGAVPELAKRIWDSDPSVRISAVNALSRLKTNAATAIPEITRALVRSEDRSVRSMSAFVLGGIGPAAKSSVPMLLTALNDRDSRVRCSVAYALVEFGIEPEHVLPTLIQCILKESTEYNIATSAIAKIGPKAAPAIPYLIRNLKKESPEYKRHGAISALAGIGPAATAALRQIGTHDAIQTANALEDKVPK